MRVCVHPCVRAHERTHASKRFWVCNRIVRVVLHSKSSSRLFFFALGTICFCLLQASCINVSWTISGRINLRDDFQDVVYNFAFFFGREQRNKLRFVTHLAWMLVICIHERRVANLGKKLRSQKMISAFIIAVIMYQTQYN